MADGQKSFPSSRARHGPDRPISHTLHRCPASLASCASSALFHSCQLVRQAGETSQRGPAECFCKDGCCTAGASPSSSSAQAPDACNSTGTVWPPWLTEPWGVQSAQWPLHCPHCWTSSGCLEPLDRLRHRPVCRRADAPQQPRRADKASNSHRRVAGSVPLEAFQSAAPLRLCSHCSIRSTSDVQFKKRVHGHWPLPKDCVIQAMCHACI